jgi:hypothetical protein
MNRQDSETGYESYLKVLLEEFRANREVYPQLEGQVATFLTVVVTLFVAALVFFPEAITTGEEWTLLPLSVVFSLFGLGIGFRHRQFLMHELYERLVLRPKIERLLQVQLEDNSVSVLEWEEFSERTLIRSRWVGQWTYYLQGAAVSLLPIVISIGLILVFAISRVSSNTNWTFPELALLILSVVLLGLQALGYLVTLHSYRQVLRAQPSEESLRSPTVANKDKAEQ